MGLQRSNKQSALKFADLQWNCEWRIHYSIHSRETEDSKYDELINFARKSYVIELISRNVPIDHYEISIIVTNGFDELSIRAN